MLGLFMEAASEWAENEKSTATAQPPPAPSKKVKKRQKPQDSGESSGMYNEKMSSMYLQSFVLYWIFSVCRDRGLRAIAIRLASGNGLTLCL